MKLDRVIAVRNNKIVYRDGDACVKVFNDDYSKADVISEALNQARMEETGLNIPQVREIITVDGKWAIVSDYIKGKTLQQLMEEDVENKERYIELFVDLQLKVHSESNLFLGKMKDKINRKIRQSGLDDAVCSDLHRQIEEMPERADVCHGDFNPSNILVTDDGKAYIIDWAHAAQGDALADVAVTYLIFSLHGDTDTAKKYLELYCQKSGAEKGSVYKWMPAAAAAHSVKANEKDREFLLSMVNVI